MRYKLLNNFNKFARGLASFYYPAISQTNITQTAVTATLANSAVLLPTYSPSTQAYQLIQDIHNWHPELNLIIIDDCTPLEAEGTKVLAKIKSFAKDKNNIVLLRTPQNALKAGALNYGIKYLREILPQVEQVFAMDDDVALNRQTLATMTDNLRNNPRLGAICSQAIVSNKNVNILTRLQALEYHSFNITKTADNGFLYGPLVMQGMLTLYRGQALKDVQGFSANHLIEDYDITVRIKKAGWKVGIAKNATADTLVPETFEGLWKQRVRWCYGGLTVVSGFWKKPTLIFQDIFGHLMFLSLITLIILSLMTGRAAQPDTQLVSLVIILSIINFAISFTFSLAIMFSYKQRDKIDWLIKLTIIPEFIYANLLSFVLIGSYIFYVYNFAGSGIMQKLSPVRKLHNLGLSLFQAFGYSSTWGTK